MSPYRRAEPPPTLVERVEIRPRPNVGLLVVLGLLGLATFALVASWTSVRCERVGASERGACVARTLSFRGATAVAFALEDVDRLVVEERRGAKRSVRSTLVLVERSGARRALEPSSDSLSTQRRYAVARELGLFQVGRDASFEATFGGASVAVGALAFVFLLIVAASELGHGAVLEVDVASGWVTVRRRVFGVFRRPLDLPLQEIADVVPGGTRKAPRLVLVRASGESVPLTAGRLDEAALGRVRASLRALQRGAGVAG